MATNHDDLADDNPLPLVQLRSRVSPSTYAWLECVEREDAKFLAELDETALSINLFSRNGGTKDNDNDQANTRDEEEDVFVRVQTWSTSTIYPDGYMYSNVNSTNNSNEQPPAMKKDDFDDDDNNKKTNSDSSSVTIQYILSNAGGGHGDDLWAAARHVGNVLADPVQCRHILSILSEKKKRDNDDDDDEGFCTTTSGEEKNDRHRHHHHPLWGLKFLELGAGGGVPSWTALQCGAHVVCTDQKIPNRLRCLAESAERNVRLLRQQQKERRRRRRKKRQQQQELVNHKSGVNDDDHFDNHVAMAQVCPYDWGTSTEEIVEALQACGGAAGDTPPPSKTDTHCSCCCSCCCLFDVIVAADCIYLPECHTVLLQSIHQLLKPSGRGVALLPFALHGNTPDDTVWAIADLAQQPPFEFHVDILEAKQLTPQSQGMESKRGLVHTLRLTLPPPSSSSS
jgi:predicted nicotinamide N-methyase